MKLERIIPEIKALTNGIYYKKLQELLDFLIERNKKGDIWHYKIICNELLYDECKTIGMFFKIEVIKSLCLPEGVLITCVNFYELLNNNMNYIF